MKGQIEEQHGSDINAVREAYKQGVSISWLLLSESLKNTVQRI
jgi:hypothetical protein